MGSYDTVALDVTNLSGGEFARELEDAIQRVVNDCLERPGIEKARTVSVDLTFVPQGMATPVPAMGYGYTLKVKLPGRKSEVSLALVQDGTLQVSPVAGEDPRQGRLPGTDGENVVRLNSKQG